MLENEQCFWLELVSRRGLGPKVLKKLYERFGSAAAISGATKGDLAAMGARPKAIKALGSRPEVDLARLERVMKEERIGLACLSDEDYPSLLREVSDPPPVFFHKGNLAALAPGQNFLAVVGSRKCTHYAKEALGTTVAPLAVHGFCIVSGLAYGVDSLAHREALAQGMPTVAVLGSGVSQKNMHPAPNRHLAEEIVAKGGLVLSEFWPWTSALPQFFVQRNRIIAGLTQATLVVEAAAKSGALITAQMALGYARDVLAVPGSIFSAASQGTNELISQGAAAARSHRDILGAFGIEEAQEREAQEEKLAPEERKILELMRERRRPADELAQEANFTITRIHSIVSLLEIKGLL